MYPDSTRTLLSYSDIRENGIHMETYEENKEEFLLLQRILDKAKRHLKGVLSPICIVLNLHLTRNICCVQNNSLLITSRFGKNIRVALFNHHTDQLGTLKSILMQPIRVP